MNKITFVVILSLLSSSVFAQDRTVVNDENVCWILKQAVQLTGSDDEVKCPVSEKKEEGKSA